ncbi:MAG TPA: hypothetical protein VFR63_05990 [Gaiellaceae bacterium]|nr:hypothetical protein [Gaiellaceae bacterium]
MPSSPARETPPATPSSRTSRAGAGWRCTETADLTGLYRPGYTPTEFNWINPKPLWESRNDRIARWIGDSTDDERVRWVEAQRRKGVDPTFVVSTFADRDELSFFLLGDPGEGDDSQYHVLGPLNACSEGIAFTYVVSDVIYPAGDVRDYWDKFFWPYQKLPGPIYAIPGNHDWYDGLHGFMIQLCDADPDLRPPAHLGKNRLKRAFLDLTWREPSEAKQEELEEMRQLRPDPSNQPAPYFALELKELLLVGIDTGIRGCIDAEQGAWLREVSQRPKDKILLTGKPLVVDAERRTILVSGTDDTVNAIVDDPAHRYIAVVGGDIHNYQRYSVRQPDDRVVQHIVTGAAGAYTKATHKIPRATVEGCGCDEADFRCYPRRGDSLAAYSVLYDRKFGFGKGLFAIPFQEAPKIMSLRLEGIDPRRAKDRAVDVSQAALRASKFVFPFSGAGIAGPLYRNFSEFLDWNDPDPPLFKSFLKVDVRPGELELRCFAATGCAEHADNPPLEDRIRGTREGDGRWKWDVLLD